MERPQGAAASDRADTPRPEVGRNGTGPHPDRVLNSGRPSSAGAESAPGDLLADDLDQFELRPDIDLQPGGDELADSGGTDEGVREMGSPRFRRARRRAKQTQPEARQSGLPHGPAPLKALAPAEEPTPSGRPAPVAAPMPSADRTRPEWCTIVLARTDERSAEFHVVTVERDGQRRVTGRSSSFRVPRSQRLHDRGDARAAHDALVQEVLAAGWQPLEARGRWHDTAFIRRPQES